MNTAGEGSSSLGVKWGLLPLFLVVDMLHVTGGGFAY